MSSAEQKPTLDDLKDEYAEHVIGPKLLGMLLRQCRRKAQKYPPSTYNAGQPWDQQSFENLAQDVCTNVLLAGNYVHVMFRSLAPGDGIDAIERQVYHAIYRTLKERRRSLEPIDDRLVRRCIAFCTDEGFPHYVSTSRKTPRFVFGTTEPSTTHEVEWSHETVTKIVNLQAVREVPRLFTATQQKQSSGYAKEQLRTVLTAITAEMAAVHEDNLRKIFQQLFTFLMLPTYEPDEEMDFLDTQPTVNALSAETRRKIVALADSLSDRLALVITYKTDRLSDEEISQTLGCSRPTVQKDRETAGAAIRALIQDLDLTESEMDLAFAEFQKQLLDRAAEVAP